MYVSGEKPEAIPAPQPGCFSWPRGTSDQIGLTVFEIHTVNLLSGALELLCFLLERAENPTSVFQRRWGGSGLSLDAREIAVGFYLFVDGEPPGLCLVGVDGLYWSRHRFRRKSWSLPKYSICCHTADREARCRLAALTGFLSRAAMCSFAWRSSRGPWR